MAHLSPNVVIILGPAGAGKSVQADALAQLFNWRHVSTGELLRQANDPELNREMAAGELAETAKVEDLLLGAIGAVPAETGIILDGFPRTLPEAEWLGRTLPALGRGVRAVLLLEVDPAEAARRLAGRGRADDAAGAQLERQHEFEIATRPVVQHFGQLGLLVRVDGVGPVAEITQRLQDALA